MSRFSLVEMTRQRQRESLKRTTYDSCVHCSGTGYIKSVESVALESLREIRLRLVERPEEKVSVVVSPNVAEFLRTRKQDKIDGMSQRFAREIEVLASKELRADEVRFV